MRVFNDFLSFSISPKCVGRSVLLPERLWNCSLPLRHPRRADFSRLLSVSSPHRIFGTREYDPFGKALPRLQPYISCWFHLALFSLTHILYCLSRRLSREIDNIFSFFASCSKKEQSWPPAVPVAMTIHQRRYFFSSLTLFWRGYLYIFQYSPCNISRDVHSCRQAKTVGAFRSYQGRRYRHRAWSAATGTKHQATMRNYRNCQAEEN